MGEEPASMKELCLKLLLILCTGMENISQNTLIEYLTYTSVFESLIHLLSSAGEFSLLDRIIWKMIENYLF